MRRPLFAVLLLTAALLVGAAAILAGCEDLDGAGGTETTTSTAASLPVTTTGSLVPLVTVTSLQTLSTEPAILVTNRYEEDNPLLAWTGSWTFTGGADDSGGSCRYTEDAGSSVTVKFSGVSVSLITRTGLALGKINVTLDSGSPVTIDCYTSAPAYEQIVWFADPLPEGTHYVKIECAGTANPASAGTGVYVDAFAITGTLE